MTKRAVFLNPTLFWPTSAQANKQKSNEFSRIFQRPTAVGYAYGGGGHRYAGPKEKFFSVPFVSTQRLLLVACCFFVQVFRLKAFQ